MDHEKTAKQRELDEAATQLVDTFPRLWWMLYQNSIHEGFTPEQALSFVHCFIMRDGANGVNFRESK